MPEFPRLLYRHGTETRVVADADALTAALADGWHRSRAASLAANETPVVADSDGGVMGAPVPAPDRPKRKR